MNTVSDSCKLEFPPSTGWLRAKARDAAGIWLAIFALWFGLAPAMGQTRTATFNELRDIPEDSGVVIHGAFSGGGIGIRFDVLGPSYFTPRDTVILNGGKLTGRPQNGTPFLQQDGPNVLIATSHPQSSLGGRFAVISVDLAEYSTVVGVELASFVGYRTDGGVVNAEFMPDGIIDGEGPLVDFETYYFDEQFNDLIRFEAVQFASLDNLVFAQAVPEPSTWMLVCLGAAVFAAVRRCR